MRKFFYFLLTAVTVMLAACGDYNAPTNPNSDQGALKGEFTINSYGKKVRFSQGNLQYNPAADKWKFAANQWEYIGDENANIAKDYDGWIDLFGFGTGSYPVNCSNYWQDYTSFSDWGLNPILNGGNQKYLWRTLKSDEWKYLIHERDQKLFGFGKVNGIPGLIILPDDWILPEGLVFNPGTQKGLAWESSNNEYINSKKDNYSHNSYEGEEWTKMETAGAVFLPVTRLRSGSKLYPVTSLDEMSGWYWSFTHWTASYSYSFEFNGWLLTPASSDTFLHRGYAVRLVQTVK